MDACAYVVKNYKLLGIDPNIVEWHRGAKVLSFEQQKESKELLTIGVIFPEIFHISVFLW